jgi:hypothetical protein
MGPEDIESWRKLLADAGIVFVIVAALLIAVFFAARTYIEGWIRKRFDAQLKAMEQAHARHLQDMQFTHDHEIERIRETVQATFSRISKVHEKEFEVLPKMWSMLHLAHGAAHALVVGSEPAPNFEALNDEESLMAVLDVKEFSAIQKNAVRQSSDQMKTYLDIVRLKNIHRGKTAQIAFNNYILENQIFLSVELADMMHELSLAYAVGIAHFESGHAHGQYKMVNEGCDSITRTGPRLQEVRRAIQKRLGQDVA